MVNKYKRKTTQATWETSTMRRAMEEVTERGQAVKSVAKRFGIPRTTLQRHLKSGSCEKKLGRFVMVFSSEQETELLEYVFHMDALFYGLSKQEFLELVYNYAQLNNIPNPFKNGVAGLDWYKGFTERHPDLTLRKPEPTSIARARGFNKPQVYRFFDLLEQEIEKHDIDATRLYNMDETGIQTSSNKPPKVLTKTGKRQVGLIASTERGRTTTVICCCNAAGSFIPPFMIFARKRMNSRLLDGAPPSTQGTCSDNGWINGPVFLEWLRFFVETVRPTADKKVLLVLDNHESHKYLHALEFASKNHVIFVSLAPHTTHRMQPLDYCVYGPLKTYFEQAVAVFQKAHAGRIINQSDVAKLFADAYMKAASANNAVNGFKTTGLFPPNRYIFDDADFLPATVTENTLNPSEPSQQTAPSEEERDLTPSPSTLDQMIERENMTPPISNSASSIAVSHVTPQTAPSEKVLDTTTRSPLTFDQMIQRGNVTPPFSNSESPIAVGHATPTQTAPSEHAPDRTTPSSLMFDQMIQRGNKSPPAISKTPSTIPVSSGITTIETSVDTAATPGCSTHQSPMLIRPVPKVAPNKTTRRRKTQKAEILTSTPIKDEQRLKLEKKKKSSEKAGKRNLKEELSAKKHNIKNNKQKVSQKSTTKPTKAGASGLAKIARPARAARPARPAKTANQYYCFVCHEPYEDPPTEDWIRCNDCDSWAHEACTSYSGIRSFYCDLCQEI